MVTAETSNDFCRLNDSLDQSHTSNLIGHMITLRASCGAVYCNRFCLCVWVCLWVCYHDNSKLRASILTKLGF